MDDMAILATIHTRPSRQTRKIVYKKKTMIISYNFISLLVETLALYLVGLFTFYIVNSNNIRASIPHPFTVSVSYAVIMITINAIHYTSPGKEKSLSFPILFSIAFISVMAMILFEHASPIIGYWFAGASLVVVLCRRAEQAIMQHFGGVSRMRRRAAFIGNNHVASEILQTIRASSHQDIEPIGFFDDRTSRRGPLDDMLPHLGNINDLVAFVHENELDEVYVALPWSANERITYLINQLRFLPLTVRLLPDHLPPALSKGAPVQIGSVVASTLMLPPTTLTGRIMKRCFDVVISSLLLIVLIPIFTITALLIKIDSRGPVFFIQPRSGQYGRIFNILKFRSMYTARLDTAAETLVSHGDIRVTRVGRVIRKYSIDEIPQILNVFLGDMSLVGPRPHAQRAKAAGRVYTEILDDYMHRYRVKPGITGWAQVNGWRGNTDTEEKLRKRVEFDFYYITHWSLRLDFEILLKTFRSVVSPPQDNV